MGEIDYAQEQGPLPRRVRPAITRDDLGRKLAKFQNVVNQTRVPQLGAPAAYRLDWANGGVRVETADESRTVSPRLTKRGLCEWLDAAILGLWEVTR